MAAPQHDTLQEQLTALRDRAKELAAQGRLRESLAVHEEALCLAPDAVIVHLSAARIAHALELQEVSLRHFEAAAHVDPRCHPAIEGARRICIGAGLADRAERYSRLAYALLPTPQVHVAMKLIVPSIMGSKEGVAASRERYARGLEELLAATERFEAPSGELGVTQFFLAYHGENDRELQMAAARAYRRLIPRLEFTAPHCRAGRSSRDPQARLRIGFISRFFAAHSIFSTSVGLIEKLARDRFEVIVLRITPSRSDDCTARIRAAADQMVDLDPDLYRARDQIAHLALDILFYQDLGMEPMSYFLAFARLAPVQCVSFGHPNTTGVPTIDYFISNDVFEPSGAEAHYSETLVQLRGLPTLAYYHEPKAPDGAASARDFGLPAKATLYVCPQTLFKLHPDFDPLLGGILAQDPRGVIVLIAGQFQEFTDRLRTRLARTVPEAASRLYFLPFMAFARFMQLLRLADVVLDTPHFNGMNSSLQAFAVGAPVVTLPGRFQRGRHTQAMYRHMGILECIARDAADYVAIATRIGMDRGYARSLRERILARKHRLFEDLRVVREFERFFLEAARDAA